jgi:hypothetical protein
MIEPKYLKNLQVALEVKQFTRRTKGTCNYGIAPYHTFLQGGQDMDAAVIAETPPKVSAMEEQDQGPCSRVCWWSLVGKGVAHGLEHGTRWSRAPKERAEPRLDSVLAPRPTRTEPVLTVRPLWAADPQASGPTIRGRHGF